MVSQLDPSTTVYQCKDCGFRWRSLSLLWSWSYYCPWCGKLQPTQFLAVEWDHLRRVVGPPPGEQEDENDKIPTTPGIKIPPRDEE